ncbi:hypothetical protein Tco_0397320 [Tanacetum coccineum]
MYADDVIFFGEWSWVNAHNLISMLQCFFLISGLKINVHKSNVLGVGVTDEDVSQMANIIGCGMAKLPLKYLGVLCIHSLDGGINAAPNNSHKRSTWGSILLSINSLKQKGDPLVPYLFILVMESLHLSFSRTVDVGIFKGIQIGKDFTLSRLFYADDAVFIGEWSDENLSQILHVLHCFSLASGLKINVKKSHLLGGTDIQEQDQKESQNQTKPSTEWKGQSQRSTK